MKSFKYSGVWWLPSKEEHKVAGEAVFAEDDQTKLVLNGIFDHDFKPGIRDSLDWYPIILGTTEAGQPITLFNCWETHLSLHFREEEGGEQECRAEIAFIGTHFTDPQHIFFNKVDTHYSYLPQWADIFPYRGYQRPFDEVRASTTKGTITVQPIRSVWDELTKETDLINEVDLSEVVRMRFEVQEALSLDGWMAQFVSPLQHLISLATQRPNAIVNIVGYVKQKGADQSNSDVLEVPVQIAFPPAIIPIPTSRSTVPGTILFSLQEIASNFTYMIDTWLNMADELDSAYRLFFGVQYTNLPLDLRFLLITQAVEVYQDHRFDETPLSKEEYQGLLEIILAASPEKQRKWLENALKHSNNATYRQQLRNLVTKTYAVLDPLLGKNRKKRDEFTEVAYNTRNYLTHHTKELAPNAARGIELFYITRCLSLALQVCLMDELGFTTQRLVEIMHKHEDYGRMLVLQPQVNLEKLISQP